MEQIQLKKSDSKAVEEKWEKFWVDFPKEMELKDKVVLKLKRKKYSQQPEVLARIKEYRKKPEVKARKKAYSQRPEVKARKKAYSQRPEVLAREKERATKRYIQLKNKENKRREKLGIKLIGLFKTAEEKKEKQKEYSQRPEVKARMKEYYQENKEKISKGEKEYYQKNKEKIKTYHKEYRKTNKKKIQVYNQTPRRKKSNSNYVKKRRRNDPLFLLQCRLSNSLRSALKRYSKTGKIKTSNKYGVNYDKIIENLKPFPKRIGNYEVDHIIPLSWFNFNNQEEIKWAFAPENHQWLTKKENQEKKNRYIYIK